MSPAVRAPRFSDTAAVYRICFETGPDFPRAAERRPTPELLGHVWAGPYLAFAPEWCRVVVDERGVAGYLLAAPDTAAFARWAEAEWWPPLRADHPVGHPALSPADHDVAMLLADPPAAPQQVVAMFPAHLHIDFHARLRGRGFARRLIDDLVERLAAAGVAGVHLRTGAGNARAIAVYEHLGFHEVARTPEVVWMGRVAARSPGAALEAGPFFHGTRAALAPGDLLTAGFRSNYRPEIVMNHVYFTALRDPAGLAAELAAGDAEPRVYLVRPTGAFEDDPNVTDRRFPGNPTRSYRSSEPVEILEEVRDWTRLAPDALQRWRDRLAVLRADERGEILN